MYGQDYTTRRSRRVNAAADGRPSRARSHPAPNEPSPADDAIDATIDRDSPVPFYLQLAELLEHEIVRGRWEAGLRLPSELNLCGHFGVSRTTPRQALGRLEQQGLVSARKVAARSSRGHVRGRGYSSPQAGSSRRKSGWASRDLAGASGRARSASGLGVRRSRAAGRQPGVTLERVRAVDGLVAMYVVNHLPERFADAVFGLGEDESLYQRLREEHGIAAGGGRRLVKSLPSEELLAKLLKVAPRMPLLFIESVTWNGSGEPFGCYQTWLRTDRMKIEIEVVVGPSLATPSSERSWDTAS
jgi:GntR family transcriptional regulator